MCICSVACSTPQGDGDDSGGGDSEIVTPGGDETGGGDSGSGDSGSGDNSGDSGSGDGEGNDLSFGPDSSVPTYLIISNQEELDNALTLVEEGQTIFVKQGTIRETLVIEETSVSFTLCGEKNSDGELISILPKIEISNNTQPITIKYLLFTMSIIASEQGGIKLNSTDNILVEECTFNNNVFIQGVGDVKNLTVNNCTFKNIVSEYENSQVSAINMPRYQNFTLKNSYFENIEYNVVQIGQHLTDREPVLNGGDVLVEGNTFKNIGSRILYFVYLNTVNICQVVNNKFYSNEDSFAADGNDTGAKKTDGLYVHTKTTGLYRLKIGVNYWEEIPEAYNKKYLPQFADYNEDDQLLISE